MPGATYMGVFAGIANGISSVGAAARGAVSELKQAAVEAKAFRAEVESARESTSTMAKAGGSTNTKQLAAALKAVR